MEFISEEYFEAIENSGRRVKDLHLPHNVYSVTADSTALQALEVMKDRVLLLQQHLSFFVHHSHNLLHST